MTDQKQSEISPKVKQKVAQEVEANTTADDTENPEAPNSEECDVPKTNDAPAEV